MATTGTQVITRAQEILRDTAGRRYTSAILLNRLNEVLTDLSEQGALIDDNYRIPLTAFVDTYSFPSDMFKPQSMYLMPDPQAIQNADFSTTGVWSGTNWTVAVGGATHATGSTEALSQSVANINIGEPWRVSITISGRTAGSVTMALQSGTAGSAVTANGETIQVLTAGTGSTITVTPTTDFDGTVTKVRLLRNNPRLGVYRFKKMSRPMLPSGLIYGLPAVWYNDEGDLLTFKVAPIPDTTVQQSDVVLVYQQEIPRLSLAGDTLATGVPDSIWNSVHYGVAARAVMSSEDPNEIAYYATWENEYTSRVINRLNNMRNTTTDRAVVGRSWRR